ncbi:MAG TPA: methyltransferase domain-containing protein [Nitrospira sp.]|nr:methyltransferase domain-containing protein [Nitrospira sp.]
MTLLDRLLVQTFVKIFSVSEPVFEVGSHQLREGGNAYQDLRPFFIGKKFIGSDFSPGPGVDCATDATQLGIKQGSVGTVVMVSTIEHIFRVFDAFDQVHRVLSPGGTLIVTSHMDCGIHAYPSDYWRFTPEAFARLLDNFPAKIIGYQGLSYNPFVVFGVAFKSPPENFNELSAQFRLALERAMKEASGVFPVKDKMARYRRLVLWRLFGSKDAYRKLRDEHVIGWRQQELLRPLLQSTTNREQATRRIG